MTVPFTRSIDLDLPDVGPDHDLGPAVSVAIGSVEGGDREAGRRELQALLDRVDHPEPVAGRPHDDLELGVVVHVREAQEAEAAPGRLEGRAAPLESAGGRVVDVDVDARRPGVLPLHARDDLERSVAVQVRDLQRPEGEPVRSGHAPLLGVGQAVLADRGSRCKTGWS